jgi:purine-binding chemotaxis protein CheW
MERTNAAKAVQAATRQVVSFSLDLEEFGVDILKVQEIVKLQKIARVPRSPDFVEGVINLRGNVIPVIDLRKKFGLSAVERTGQNRIIVFNLREKMVGVLVDRVEKVLRISEDQIEAPPDLGAGVNQAFIEGIGKLGPDLITLVDIEAMLSDQELFDLKDVGAAKEAVRTGDASAAPVPKSPGGPTAGEDKSPVRTKRRPKAPKA